MNDCKLFYIKYGAGEVYNTSIVEVNERTTAEIYAYEEAKDIFHDVVGTSGIFSFDEFLERYHYEDGDGEAISDYDKYVEQTIFFKVEPYNVENKEHYSTFQMQSFRPETIGFVKKPNTIEQNFNLIIIYFWRKFILKKIFAVLLTLVMMFSFTSVAFAANYNWGKEPVSCEEYTIDITKYEMVVENGKSKLVESANVAAKKGDTVYFSVNVYNKEYKNEELELVWRGSDFYIANDGDINVSVTGIKDIDVYSESKAIFKGVVYADVPCLTISIQSTSTIQDLVNDGTVVAYGSAPCRFVKIGNILFERDANYYVVNAYQYDKNVEAYLKADDYTAVKLLKEANDVQLAAFGMTSAFVTEGVYLMDNTNLEKNLGTSCLAEKTVCWGTPVVPGANDTLGIPKTGDASIGMYIGAALIILGIAGGAWYVVSKRKESAN